MNPNDANRECLLRSLEGRVTAAERARVDEWLRDDPDARAFLREVAEQAVMVADLERTALGRQAELHSNMVPAATRSAKIVPIGSWIRRRRRVAIAAAVAAAAGLVWVAQVFRLVPSSNPDFARVTMVTGSSQYFGANGRVDNSLAGGMELGVGDTLETRSCDAWIELDLREGSTVTIAGHSTLRMLDVLPAGQQFKLHQGNLWVHPGRGESGKALVIQTPTGSVEARSAQLDIQTSSSESIVRVNEGFARVTQLLDSRSVEVPANHQVSLSLSGKRALIVKPQPKPVTYWACDFWQIPEVKLGKWLPATSDERARLGAEPLLWPIPGRDPVTLYAVALAAWRSSERPVLLQSGSKVLIRGRTERAQTVRFGFSTQKMRGVFSGKFEVDVEPESLGPVGKTWLIELPLALFRPLHPHLSASADGLELTDIYALTVATDAGLEIHHFEVIPPDEALPAP